MRGEASPESRRAGFEPPTGTTRETTGASDVAVMRVRVGTPPNGRLMLSVTASTPGDEWPTTAKRLVLNVRGR